MRTVRIVYDFIRCPVAVKIALGRTIEKRMTGNPNFPSPDVPLSELKSSTDKVESHYIATLNGNKAATALLNKEVEIWNDYMRVVARYVERMANNVESVVLSSGFNLAKPPIPGRRAEFSVKHGEKPGSALLRRKALKNGYSYVWQYCKNTLAENESDWTIATITVQASVELNNLIPITKYWFCVAVVTPQGITAYCNPIMHIVR